MDRAWRRSEAILGQPVPGTFVTSPAYQGTIALKEEEKTMDGLIYLIGLIVVIMAILSFFGLR
jgi:hypothetical protein